MEYRPEGSSMGDDIASHKAPSPDERVLEELITITEAMVNTGRNRGPVDADSASLASVGFMGLGQGPIPDATTTKSPLASSSSLDVFLPSYNAVGVPRLKRSFSEVDLDRFGSSPKSNSLASKSNSLDSLSRINPDSLFSDFKCDLSDLTDIKLSSPSSLSFDPAGDLLNEPQLESCISESNDTRSVSFTNLPVDLSSKLPNKLNFQEQRQRPSILHTPCDTLQPVSLSFKPVSPENLPLSGLQTNLATSYSDQPDNTPFRPNTLMQTSDVRHAQKTQLIRKESSVSQSLATEMSPAMCSSSDVLSGQTNDGSFLPISLRNGSSPSSPPMDLMSIDTPNESGDEDFLNQPSTSSVSKIDSLGDTIIQIVNNEEIKDFSDARPHFVSYGAKFQKDILFKQALKEELKLKIQVRREFGEFAPQVVESKRTQSLSSFDKPSSVNREQTESEMKRKLKNREHARMSRQRAHKERLELAQQNEALERSLQILETEKESLESKYKSVESWLSSHFSCEIQKTNPRVSSKTIVTINESRAIKTPRPKKPKSISILPFSASSPSLSLSVPSIRKLPSQSRNGAVKGNDIAASELHLGELRSTKLRKSHSRNKNEPLWLLNQHRPTEENPTRTKLKYASRGDFDSPPKSCVPAWLLEKDYPKLEEDDDGHLSPWEVGNSHRKSKGGRENSLTSSTEVLPKTTLVRTQQPGVTRTIVAQQLPPKFTDTIHTDVAPKIDQSAPKSTIHTQNQSGSTPSVDSLHIDSIDNKIKSPKTNPPKHIEHQQHRSSKKQSNQLWTFPDHMGHLHLP